MQKAIHNFLIISLGNLIYTVAVAFFILPNNLITGGTTGLALFGQYMFHIPITAFVYVFNIAMFLLGAWVLGKAFALTTILSTFEYPFFLSILQLLSSRVGPLTDDRMLATLFAGAGIGIGLGLVIQAGASTGGMDIPPLVIEKKLGFPVSVSLYLFDFCILILQIFISDREQVLYGILLVVLYTVILDRLLILKVHIQDIMVCIWQKFVQNIIGRQCQAGGVDAWVASDQWLIDNFLIHDKLNMMIVIIHQSENTCRARSQIKVGFHIFRRSKR